MFAIVAIQKIMLDYKVATKEFSTWEVQHEWQKQGEQGELIKNVKELLIGAEEDDTQQENNQVHWCRPTVRKKVKKDNQWCVEGFHKPGKDFTFIGTQGYFDLHLMGWEDIEIPTSEVRGFEKRQNILVEHYAWY